MKEKKGFTLVELLAVILVIAVPQIMSVIESARKGSIESTAKLIAEGAEREYTNRKILGKDTNIKCSDVSSMNSNDYGTCVITFDNRGKVTVKVTGKGEEAFAGKITTNDGKYYYAGLGLTSVIIPSSVTSIGNLAFAGNQLTSITFPSTPLTIGCYTFANNPITNDATYMYPSNVTLVDCPLK